VLCLLEEGGRNGIFSLSGMQEAGSYALEGKIGVGWGKPGEEK